MAWYKTPTGFKLSAKNARKLPKVLKERTLAEIPSLKENESSRVTIP